MITPAYAPTATERVLPRLALDFTTAFLDARVTVTRALNMATRINSSGLVEVVNANLPRFDYTLNTGGACKGLLIEESRTNIIRKASDFTQTANWTAGAAGGGVAPTYTSTTTTAPDGTNTAQIWSFTAATTSDRSFLSQTVSGLATGFWASSVFMKAGRPEDVGKIIAVKETQGATYTLVTLTAAWQRPESINTSAATSHGMAIELRPLVNTSSGTVQVALWNAQTEAGAFVTSAIPNDTTGPVTRNADVVAMTGSNFSSWYQAGSGTLQAIMTRYAVATGFPRIASLNDNTVNNEIAILAFNPNAGIGMGVTNGGATQASTFISLTGNEVDMAMRYGTNDFAISLNSSNVTTDTSGTVPTVNQMLIGTGPLTSSPICSGWYKKIFFFNNKLINNELRSVSKL